MVERTLTPSKITAWLDCAAYLDLKHQVEAGLRERPPAGMSSFARLLADKGLAHEEACLQDYVRPRAAGADHPGPAAPRVVRTRGSRASAIPSPAMTGTCSTRCLSMHDGIRGIADFLLRVVAPDGSVSVEPVDAKLARQEAKPGHVLQLSFYAEAIEAATGARPERMHLWLGSGQVESLLTADFAAYWQRLRTRLRACSTSRSPPGAPCPEPCDHCAFCEFADVCDHSGARQDSLVFVAGLRSVDRARAAGGGREHARGPRRPGRRPCRECRSSGRPASSPRPGCSAQARRAAGRASRRPSCSSRRARSRSGATASPCCPSPTRATCSSTSRATRSGGPTRGCSSCSGSSSAPTHGAWEYRTLVGARPGRRRARRRPQLIDYLRRAPGAVPRDARLPLQPHRAVLAGAAGGAARRGRVALEELVETGAFVDLLVVARNAVQVGTESYGLKPLERLTGYERGHDIDKGAGAVVEYERWMATRAADALDAIAAYNEDDVRATRAVRDWLVEHRARGAALAARRARPGRRPARARRSRRAAPRRRPGHAGAPARRRARVLAAGVEGVPGPAARRLRWATPLTCSRTRRCSRGSSRSGWSSAWAPTATRSRRRCGSGSRRRS